MREFVFGKQFETRILKNVHGDSSGVRGAAWLWPLVANEVDDGAIVNP
jgi:fructokinase